MTARPGMVIGKKGEDIEKLRVETAKILKTAVADMRINIGEIRKPELDSAAEWPRALPSRSKSA
jgi:small subunit ribosomal protein S3